MCNDSWKPWKQLVFYDFDRNMTKEILFDIIEKIEATGYSVVGMVSDLGPTNVKLWKTLGIGIENCYFRNPAAPDRDVYVFADAPHLIKLIRNNFLDSGFQFPDGRCVLSGCVRELISRIVSDLKTAHRLSESHIYVDGFKRMKVSLAAQLLSESTAKSLEYFGNRGLLQSKEWDDTSQFFYLSDSWFDVMNSRAPYNQKVSRHAYGLNLETQNDILNRMIHSAKTLKVIGSKCMYQFQKGLIVSSQSLQKLYNMVKKRYNLSYLLTHRLNQDGLEHLFGKLRQLGASYEHPSPVAFKHRVRAHILGRDSKLLADNSNIEWKDDDVSASLVNDISECSNNSVPTDDVSHEDSLEHELCLSAMMFASLDAEELEAADDTENSSVDDVMAPLELEQEMKTEGLRYVGGYLAFKFPQHDFLGSHVKIGEGTWNEAASRSKKGLMTPSDFFFKELKKMENLFLCYHGESSLKPSKNSTKTLAAYVCKYVPLPKEVIAHFVRIRMFF